MSIGLIDIGGTSIKFATYANGELIKRGSVPTPDSLDGFYAALTEQVDAMKADANITGVGISSPGSVDQADGVIRGASAIPYIHNFPIVAALEDRFGLPVGIENDANCAALAESTFGAGKGIKDLVFLVLGTGVGGAIVLDGKIRHGKHLIGGEYGYMLDEGKNIVSINGTIVNAAGRYNKATGNDVDGEELYHRAKDGDAEAKAQVDGMLHTVAKTIFNLQYSIDPDAFIIAGAISANPLLPADLGRAMDRVLADVAIAEVRPDIRIAQFRGDANLYGAAANYAQQLNTSL